MAGSMPASARHPGILADDEGGQVGQSGFLAAFRKWDQELAMNLPAVQGGACATGQFGIADRPAHADGFEEDGPGAAEDVGEVEHGRSDPI